MANMATKMAIKNREIPKEITKMANMASLSTPLDWRAEGPGQGADQYAGPPGSKNLANWQTHFFSEHNSHCDSALRLKLSLPTVANSLANWQTHFLGRAEHLEDGAPL